MSLQRQHFLFSYLGPWVLVWLEFEPATSHSAADWCSLNWANQVEGELAFILVGLLIVQSSPQSLHNNCFNGECLGRHKWQFAPFSIFFSVLAAKATWLRMQDFNDSSVSSFFSVAILSGLIVCPWEIYLSSTLIGQNSTAQLSGSCMGPWRWNLHPWDMTLRFPSSFALVRVLSRACLQAKATL